MAAPKRSSLKRSLVLPFVVLIALLTGTLGVLWYWTGSKTVATLSQQLINEMAERISLTVEHHVGKSGAVLEAAFADGFAQSADITSSIDQLQQRLWTASSLTGIPGSYVYYANQAGQAIALQRTQVNEGQMRLKTQADAHRDYWRIHAIDSPRVHLSRETELFDPRQRPWFIQARNSSGHQWTPVYIDFTSEQLVMTRARQVLDAQGNFAGVVATDVSLDALQHFMGNLELDAGTRAMVLQHDGILIAASDRSTLQHDINQKLSLTHTATTTDPLLKAIYQQLQSGEHAHLSMQDQDGRYYEVAYRPLAESTGLNWVVVVVVPHDIMLAGLRLHVVLVAALGLLVLGLALGMGLRIFGRVANDMRTLTQAVRKVGNGDINTPIRVTRNDEIGELAQNFHSMRHSLFTDALTGCANRSALMHILTTLTKKDPTPFALLFIDLNRFKPLNDTYGHANGDLALIEVTQRLQANLAPEDFLARLGGDEFVVVLMGVHTEAQIQTTRHAIERSLANDLISLQGKATGQSVTVGAAIGQACYPHDGLDAHSLLKAADTDMYRRKRSTRRELA